MSSIDVDVCVIGAGAAGLVIAEFLTRDTPTRVCLVEAGPRHFADRDEPFEVRNTGKEHLGVNYGRVTSFGGTTNLWGGAMLRPSAADFRPLDGRPETGWPIAHEDMTRHLAAVEHLFGFTPSPGSVMLERDGFLVRRREAPVLPFSKKNFGAHLGPGLIARDHVTVLCGSTIRGASGDTERGLEELRVAHRDGTETRIRARRFVVSAGVVGTNLVAQQLLGELGGVVDPDQHGRFLQDHISFPIARLRPRSQGGFSRKFGYRFEQGMMFGEHFDLESIGRVTPGGFFHLSFDMSTSSLLNPVREIMNAVQQRRLSPGAIKFGDLGGLLLGGPMLGITRYLHRRLYLDKDATILTTLDIEQTPDRDWRLTPTREGCDFEWGVSDEDARLAADLMPVCRELTDRLQQEAAFDVEPIAPDPAVDAEGFRAFLNSDAVDTYHASGGFRMSGEPGAPLDRDLRLRDAPNVHLVSTAVFPRVGSSNPTHTILALGHRLAMQILG